MASAEDFLNGPSITSFETEPHQRNNRNPKNARNKRQVMYALSIASSRAYGCKNGQADYKYPPNSIKAIEKLQKVVGLKPDTYTIYDIEDLSCDGLRLKDCPNVGNWIYDVLYCGTMVSCLAFQFGNENGYDYYNDIL